MSYSNPRQLAFVALKNIYQQDAYTDIALDRVLRKSPSPQASNLKSVDRGLITQLVYGVVRRQRTLDAIIDQLGKKPAHQQPPDLRIIFHIGLYQLRYLSQIPDSAAVNTAVELAKVNGLGKLAGVVNGLLRRYTRLAADGKEVLLLPISTVEKLGILHSFPDWIVQMWLDMWGEAETEQLCAWYNQTPNLDIRVNPLRASLEQVELALQQAGINVSRLPQLPQALRLTGSIGAIQKLPGYTAGWWMVQDSSAQLVTHLLDPQPEEVIVDACAAPGGKTTHIAELMGDRGTIWACDRAPKRLKQVQANAQRLQLNSIKIGEGDSRKLSQFPQPQNQRENQRVTRVLVDAPCSGLGTLHRHPDIRWRQTPAKIQELTVLQSQLLTQAATWVQPRGYLVYATCTLNPLENEAVVQSFLDNHTNWSIQPPVDDSPAAAFVSEGGWIKVLPHHHHMDGFFMVKLQRN